MGTNLKSYMFMIGDDMLWTPIYSVNNAPIFIVLSLDGVMIGSVVG